MNEDIQRILERDLSSHQGAAALARQIKTYWEKRGAAIETTVMKIGVNASGLATPSVFVCVRSNLINGLPR